MTFSKENDGVELKILFKDTLQEFMQLEKLYDESLLILRIRNNKEVVLLQKLKISKLIIQKRLKRAKA